MPIRKHQDEFEQLMKRIVSGAPIPRWTIAHVVPGGGKSSLPVIGLHYLKRAGIVDRLCWVPPNGALRDQAIDAFAQHDADGRPHWTAVHLRHHLKIVATGNEANLSKGMDGYVTTIQSIVRANDKSPNIHVKEFQSARYLLFIDELHHYPTDSIYYRAIMPLIELARVVICGTGTLDRAYGERLPIPYDERGYPTDKMNDQDFHWITYGIHDATHDEAIIKTEFRYIEASARYHDHETNQERVVTELGDDRKAIGTALQTGYALELLEKCLEDWMAYRNRVNPRSKMLVVCSDTRQAARMIAHLTRKGINDAEIATIKEGEAADDTILRFRTKQRPRIIVTVNKAYEGLDVPCITHLACLTHIRSKPWITQMIARAWRYDPGDGDFRLPWTKQRAWVFVPNDTLIREIVEEIEAEQNRAIRDLHGNGTSCFGGDQGPAIKPDTYTPLSSVATSEYASELGGNWQSSAMTAFIQELKLQNDTLAGLSHFEIENVITAMRERDALPKSWVPPQPKERVAPEVDERGRIEGLKRTLDFLIGKAARGDGDEKQRINAIIKRAYGERSSLSTAALVNAIDDIKRWYGVDTYDGEDN